MNWEDVLLYDETSPSCLRWRQSQEVAGFSSDSSYWNVSLKGKMHGAHRIVWELHNCPIPKGYQIDHINGLRYDNRIANLRLASPTDNQCNKPKCKNNTSGYKGVSWHKSRKCWVAQIAIHKKQKHLGVFETPEDAHRAYVKAATEIHGSFANFG